MQVAAIEEGFAGTDSRFMEVAKQRGLRDGSTACVVLLQVLAQPHVSCTAPPAQCTQQCGGANVWRCPMHQLHDRAAMILLPCCSYEGARLHSGTLILRVMMLPLQGADPAKAKLYCANVGDCRAVLCRGGRAMRCVSRP